jgi:predicted phosphodiesterase
LLTGGSATVEKLKSILFKFTGSVYLPPELTNSNEKFIIHISDTPICFYNALSVLLKKLSPAYIIHTGDLVDNLKLQFSPNQTPRYERDIKLLFNILETSSAKEIYITLGNHDRKDIVQRISKRSTIVENSSFINIEGLDFMVSHYASDLINSNCSFNLYGHDLSLPSHKVTVNNYLNGITSINIIAIESQRVFKLLYPFGTDDMRLKKGKIGL